MKTSPKSTKASELGAKSIRTEVREHGIRVYGTPDEKEARKAAGKAAKGLAKAVLGYVPTGKELGEREPVWAFSNDPRLGVADVDRDGHVTATYGAAIGRKEEIERSLAADALAKLRKESDNNYVPHFADNPQGEEPMAVVILKKQSDSKKALKEHVAAEAAKAPKRAYSKIAPESKIRLLVKECPSKPGTKAEKVWNLMAKSKTVADFNKADGDMNYLKWFVKKEAAQIVG